MATYVLSGGEGSSTLFSEHEIVCGRPMSRISAEELTAWAGELLAETCYRSSNLADMCHTFEDNCRHELNDEDAELLLVVEGPDGECWLRLEHA